MTSFSIFSSDFLHSLQRNRPSRAKFKNAVVSVVELQQFLEVQWVHQWLVLTACFVLIQNEKQWKSLRSQVNVGKTGRFSDWSLVVLFIMWHRLIGSNMSWKKESQERSRKERRRSITKENREIEKTKSSWKSKRRQTSDRGQAAYNNNGANMKARGHGNCWSIWGKVTSWKNGPFGTGSANQSENRGPIKMQPTHHKHSTELWMEKSGNVWE